MKKRDTPPPTEAEIRKHNNVPVELAARYIGWSSVTIYYALQQERAPFGFASQNPKTGTWTYNISPGLLIRYKNGDLPTYRLNEVIKMASDGVEQILAQRLDGLQKILGAAIS